MSARHQQLAKSALAAVLLVVIVACSKAPPPVATDAPKLFDATLGQAWGEKLSQLPDWTGRWFVDGCCTFPGREFAVRAKDPAGDDGGFSYGELPGSHFTGAPYQPKYQKIYDARVRLARETFKVYDPMGSCIVPHGMPRILGGGPGPTEFLITPEQTIIIWDYMNEMRRIYTDGRAHPSTTEFPPSVMGHSIGHWEGDTLVVDTTNINAGIYDRSGAPHSDQVHLSERIRRLPSGEMEFDVTIDDPVMFTGPWKVRRLYRYAGEGSFDGSYCENNRNPVSEDGQTAVLGSEQ
jgi:hypothetical protein